MTAVAKDGKEDGTDVNDGTDGTDGTDGKEGKKQTKSAKMAQYHSSSCREIRPASAPLMVKLRACAARLVLFG